VWRVVNKVVGVDIAAAALRKGWVVGSRHLGSRLEGQKRRARANEGERILQTGGSRVVLGYSKGQEILGIASLVTASGG